MKLSWAFAAAAMTRVSGTDRLARVDTVEHALLLTATDDSLSVMRRIWAWDRIRELADLRDHVLRLGSNPDVSPMQRSVRPPVPPPIDRGLHIIN